MAEKTLGVSAIEQGTGLLTTTLGGIFQARAAERARKQQEELARDQAKLNIEANKGQIQQNILQGLAANLSSIIMQRAK